MSKRAIRYLLPVIGAMLIAVGCGSSDKGDSKEKSKATTKSDPKTKNLMMAQEGFEKKSDDPNACRNLAMAYVALASPQSTGKKNEVPKQPKDRIKNLKKAASTLETCIGLDEKDTNTKQMLASTYMGLSEYEKASPLLEDIARASKNDATTYYAWGLAASNAQNTADIKTAWKLFLKYAPKNDPRVKQVKAALKSLEEAKATPKAAPASADASKKSDK